MRRPNLLFLYTDEQAFNTVAAYGNRQIEMPNLNRLADESVVFDRAYVTQPVCTPSRSTLLTGLYPHTSGCTRNNVPLRPDTPCLPEMLPKGEYVTGHFGKWHLGDELFAQHGFDEWVSVEDMYNQGFSEGRDPDTRSDYHAFLAASGVRPENGEVFGRGQAARLPEALGKPAFLARRASEFIRAHRDEPFVLYVNFLEPHMPYFGPRDDQYDPAQIPLPGNFDAKPGPAQPLKTRVFAEGYRQFGHSGLPLRTPDEWRRLIANYWGLCSLVDTHVGTILGALEACGLQDDTIVVFTSDHGDMMGSHRLLAKCVMFEEALRVPMMIRLPGGRGGCRVTGPVSQVDLVPTLLDLMGAPVPGNLQGESLRGALEGGRRSGERSVFIEWNGSDTGVIGDRPERLHLPDRLQNVVPMDAVADAVSAPVRTVVTHDGWKLNVGRRGEHELYNLAADPGETENLFGREKHASTVDRLSGMIRRWQKRTGDDVKLADTKRGAR
jgi:arylsulfatase A-like enzyme